jgi:hypothetical protein
MEELVTQYLYVDSRLKKHLKTLRQADKKAVMAADRTENIVSRLKEGILRPEQIGAMTKHGEQRIKGCMKYDLGNGYRLVTFKEGQDLFVLFAGSHDDCHRWIENNRELPLADIRRRSQCETIKPLNDHKRNVDKENKRFDSEEDDNSPVDLDDRQLRRLFSGLIQSAQNSAHSS